MNNNQQLKKYFRRQIENLIFLYTWSLLDWCHMQNKILSQYIARYWWESINMLKKLQEDITDDYNTNLYMLYKRLFDFENPTTYFLKNLVWKPSVWLIKKLRETNNTNKKLKSDDLCHYLKYFLQNWSDKWTTFFKDYKSLYHSVYSCFILYQKDKENFLQFLEHYLLTFITIQIIFDTLEQIKEKNNQEYLIKPRLFIEQTRKILWTIYLELEKRIWKEKLDYCYKRLKKMLKNHSIKFDYKMKTLSETIFIDKEVLEISKKRDEQPFDMKQFDTFPIYLRSYENLQWLNNNLNYQEYLSNIITLFKRYKEMYAFSREEYDSRLEYDNQDYSFYQKTYHFCDKIWLNTLFLSKENLVQTLTFKIHNYENVKKELDIYIENVLSLYEDWIKQSIWTYCEKYNFNKKEYIRWNGDSFHNKNWKRIWMFKDYMFVDDMWKQYTLNKCTDFINCTTWKVDDDAKKDFFKEVFKDNILNDCYYVNISLFNYYLVKASCILWQQYFFIKLFDFLLDEKNNDLYVHKILSCQMYSELRELWDEELKELFLLNYVKCEVLDMLDEYYDNYFNKETKEEMMYANNEIRKNYVTLSQKLVQLKKLFSEQFSEQS